MATFIGAIRQARMAADKLVEGFVDVFFWSKISKANPQVETQQTYEPFLIFNLTDFSTKLK